MNIVALVMLVFVVLFALGGTVGSIRLFEVKRAELKTKVYKEILTEKGFAQRPGESVREALRRAAREESMRPRKPSGSQPAVRLTVAQKHPPPLPSFRRRG